MASAYRYLDSQQLSVFRNEIREEAAVIRKMRDQLLDEEGRRLTDHEIGVLTHELHRHAGRVSRITTILRDRWYEDIDGRLLEGQRPERPPEKVKRGS